MHLIATKSESTSTSSAPSTSLTPTLSTALRVMAVLLKTSLALTVFLISYRPVAAWMPDVRPDWQIKQDKINAVFVGNKTDYFKILDYDDASVLIGARDVLFNISATTLRENSRLEWYSPDADRELCALKGKPESECHNYIRVFARLENQQILLCGTNSYKPRCRHYAPTVDELNPKANFEIVRDVEAQGLCPNSPRHNSTYVFAEGQLYSGTVADFSGSDPLIYRENLRTEQYNLKQLNEPHFVGAIERNGYVLFFFRELSTEYMNFGKAVYSRVARVCKNDRGGPLYTLSKIWTSYLKARLNCSVPGEFPFYFDELQAISPVVESGLNSLVYAVFTTSTNAIPGSAVCAFNLDDVMEAFDGSFKSQKDSQSHWMPVQEDQVPDPRPGKCVEDSRMLKTLDVNFVKIHPLMHNAVPAVFGRPLLTKVNLHHRLTAIAIDSQIMSLNGEYYDVIYTGTDDGKVTKFFNIPSPSLVPGEANKIKTVVISEMQVLPVGVPVRELVVMPKTNSLLVAGDGRIVTVALHHCTLIRDCLGCLSLQDPNCAWDQQNQECKSLTASNNKFGTKSYLQSLNSTKKAAAGMCPTSLTPESMAAAAAASGNVPIVNIDLQTLKDVPQTISKKLHYSKVGLDGSGDLDMVPTVPGADDYLSNSFGSDDSKITLHSVDPDDIMNSINVPMQHAAVEEKPLQMAGNSFFVSFGILSVVIVFIFGIMVGFCVTKRNCKTTGLHPAHRKQCNTNGQLGLAHPKDINLLMKPNHYINHKKPNIDLEKDRSHECKNSTENLEKELPCKTSTLTKVKRTYL